MNIKTGRFGELSIEREDRIDIPQGILGFPDYRHFCLIDPSDDTLIMWLQSLDNPDIVFPVLEPKIFKTDYKVGLSAADQRELGLENLHRAAVLSILTIPQNVTEMTANLKAPIVINLDLQVAKQVVLQENEYSIKTLMFKQLKQHLITIQSQGAESGDRMISSVPVRNLPPSGTLKSLS